MTSPLTSIALFHVGPIPITEGVVATWGIMLVLVLGAVALSAGSRSFPQRRRRSSN